MQFQLGPVLALIITCLLGLTVLVLLLRGCLLGHAYMEVSRLPKTMANGEEGIEPRTFFCIRCGDVQCEEELM